MSCSLKISLEMRIREDLWLAQSKLRKQLKFAFKLNLGREEIITVRDLQKILLEHFTKKDKKKRS